MSENNMLVSVIMAAYNSEEFIAEAIKSVLDQDYSSLELLIVNDGSTDGTDKVINTFHDSRIIKIKQANQGVSVARNVALEHMRGDFFCFLDADDVMPQSSISSRVTRFQEDSSISFVDGCVISVDISGKPTGDIFKPTFEGPPLNQLLKLSSACFMGLSWMIRKKEGRAYRFEEDMTHSEDLYFFINLCLNDKGIYSYIKKPVLHYRRRSSSAMSNIVGLHQGYKDLLSKLKNAGLLSKYSSFYLQLKIRKIVFLSYLFDAGSLKRALKSIVKF